MTRKQKPNNLAVSVRAKLLNLARKRNVDFQLLLTRYVNERFLYRLSTSDYADRFVLKGATLFSIWTKESHRPTRDIDLLGFGDSSEANLLAMFADVLASKGGDGVSFKTASLQAAPIRDNLKYGGVRLKFRAEVALAQVQVQVDVGFGDAIFPRPEVLDIPPILGFPPPRLPVYPRETVVAEKLEAMVRLGLANSRMKDFYDIIFLARLFRFEGTTLVQALRSTFERRGTAIPIGSFTAVSSEFASDVTKKQQWQAFVRKSGVQVSVLLPDIISELAEFSLPALDAAANNCNFSKHWLPGSSWC